MSERLKDFDQAIDIMVHNYQWMIDSEKRSKTELHAKNYADYREFIVEAYKKALERAETLERLREEDSTYYNELLIKLREQNERYKQALEEISNADWNSEGLDAERELDKVTDVAFKALEGEK